MAVQSKFVFSSKFCELDHDIVVDGRVIVKDGNIETLDLPVAMEKLNTASIKLING